MRLLVLAPRNVSRRSTRTIYGLTRVCAIDGLRQNPWRFASPAARCVGESCDKDVDVISLRLSAVDFCGTRSHLQVLGCAAALRSFSFRNSRFKTLRVRKGSSGSTPFHRLLQSSFRIERDFSTTSTAVCFSRNRIILARLFSCRRAQDEADWTNRALPRPQHSPAWQSRRRAASRFISTYSLAIIATTD